MINRTNVRSEFELYEPMRQWLEIYLKDRYKGFEIITTDAHSERLKKVIKRDDTLDDTAVSIDIQIGVL